MRLAPNQRIEPLASITLRPKNGIRMELQERVPARVAPGAPAKSAPTNAASA